jgi:hypothetical protein
MVYSVLHQNTCVKLQCPLFRLVLILLRKASAGWGVVQRMHICMKNIYNGQVGTIQLTNIVFTVRSMVQQS